MKKIGKEMFANAPDGCTCEWISEDDNGWLLKVPCSVCSAITEANNLKQSKLREIEEKRAFLSSTDWKIIRHRDQKELGEITSLSDADYTQLLSDRQDARDRINELEGELNGDL